jgi:hypothetical protein
MMNDKLVCGRYIVPKLRGFTSQWLELAEKKMQLKQGFLQLFLFPLPIIILPNVPYFHSNIQSWHNESCTDTKPWHLVPLHPNTKVHCGRKQSRVKQILLQHLAGVNEESHEN